MLISTIHLDVYKVKTQTLIFHRLQTQRKPTCMKKKIIEQKVTRFVKLRTEINTVDS